MRKVMTIVGTRPEIIRLSRVIPQLDRHFEHILVHTGQNYDYELNEIFFRELDIRRPDVFLNAAGKSPAETIGQVIMAADRALAQFAPDAVLILGDTNSALSAIAAKRRKIPIFHMEAGNRCFDFRVPEEINRRIVDHLADVNLTYSEIARDYLLREGLPPDRIIKTGSPMREVLEYYRPRIEASDVLDRLSLQRGQYFVVSAHREETVDRPEGIRELLQLLRGVAEKYGEPMVVSTHPRTRARLEAAGEEIHPLIQFSRPFGFPDYVKLQTHARCVLSDSGTITEESSILNFPALNLREMHERPEGFEEAAVMFVGLNLQNALRGLDILQEQPRGEQRRLRMVVDYEPDNVSEKMVRILLSYTDFVNRVVWRNGLCAR